MNMLLKVAASSLVLGTALMGNAAGGTGIVADGSVSVKSDRQAARLAAKASKALAARDGIKAVRFAESAVALSPRNADHRGRLGQAYLLAGRFASAATAFRDALTLNPTDGPAALSLALAEIAQGQSHSARNSLAQARDFVPAPDYGLALALAGDRDSAIAVLQSAARSESASPRTRQNLALAYAMAGRWKEAHVTAAQDVPADQLPERMTKWAQFARSQTAAGQVAALLGVRPAADPGQPAKLALAPALPQPAAVAAVAVQEPARIASVAEPVASAPTIESVLYAAPTANPVQVPAIRQLGLPASRHAPTMKAAVVQSKSQPNMRGNFVVQLGAFSSPSRLAAAWDKYSGRTRHLSSYVPASTTFRSAGNAMIQRLSVGAFATRREAWALCGQIKASGGECFVRGTAGDAPMQFASRAKTRIASR